VGEYELLERTVMVQAPLDERRLDRIAQLLGRDLAYRAGTADYLIDLSDSPDADALLGYLRSERLPHTVAEERRWPAGRRS
jgi:hypothetical protein